DQPRVGLGSERVEQRFDRGRRRHFHGRPVPTVGQEPSEVAVHVHGHAHPSSARTRGITSLWKRSIVVSIRPSRASGYTMISAIPLLARRATSGAIAAGGPGGVTAWRNCSGTLGANAGSGAGVWGEDGAGACCG